MCPIHFEECTYSGHSIHWYTKPCHSIYLENLNNGSLPLALWYGSVQRFQTRIKVFKTKFYITLRLSGSCFGFYFMAFFKLFLGQKYLSQELWVCSSCESPKLTLFMFDSEEKLRGKWFYIRESKFRKPRPSFNLRFKLTKDENCEMIFWFYCKIIFRPSELT